jgi:glutathione S-transferase
VYALYYYPGNASLLPHMMLREIGAPFELRLVDRDASAHKSPEYLKLNPNGLIPVLIDRDLVVYETAAIALHLSDRHPEAGLAPAVGTDDRAHFYKWMLHLANTLQPTFLTYFYPERYIGDPAAVPLVKARAEERLDGMFDIVASELAGRHWLLGERFSAVDLFLMLLTRWGRGLKRPPRTIPALGSLAERALARPAVQAAIEAEGLKPPLI